VTGSLPIGALLILAVYLAALAGSWRYPILLAVPFLTSGLVKRWAEQNIPLFAGVDLTVVTVLVVLVGALFAFRFRRTVPTMPPLLLVLLYVLFTALVVAGAEIQNASVRRMLLQHVGFNTVALFAPFLLVRRTADLSAHWVSLVAVGVVVAFGAIIMPPTSAEARSAFLESNAITTARYCSFALLILATLWPEWTRHAPVRRAWIVPVVPIALAGMLYSGSRGPMLHLGITLLVLVVVRAKVAFRQLAVVLVLAIALVGFYLAFPEDPALQRVASIASPDATEASHGYQYRTAAWLLALDTWSREVWFGHGVGYMEMRLDLQPHSLMLEVLHSFGGVGFLLFFGMVTAAIGLWLARRTSRAAGRAEWLSMPAPALLLLALVSSTTAYSLISARHLLFWVGLTVVAARLTSREAAGAAGAPVTRAGPSAARTPAPAPRPRPSSRA